MRPQSPGMNRRTFLGATATAAAAFSIVPASAMGAAAGRVPPSERINVGYIGLGTQGLRELPGLLTNPNLQVLAVCDPNRDSQDYVDWSRYDVRNRIRDFLGDSDWGAGDQGIRGGRDVGRQVVDAHYGKNQPGGTWNGCAAYADFREMLAEQADLDAVQIMTPDHLHAAIALAAMDRGRHVVTHKPIANRVAESRKVIEKARETGLVTQLLAWSDRNLRSILQVRHWIDQGAIGRLRAVHNWIDKPIWPQWSAAPRDTPPVPDGLDWDLWLGPAQDRPYHPHYTHAVFRGWYDFGSGILGDMGHYSLCHVFDAFALDAPVSVEANGSFSCQIRDHVSGIQRNDVAFPLAATMRFRFAPKGDRPTFDIFWYDGGMRPPLPDEMDRAGLEMPASGMMFVGDEGLVLCEFLGQNPRLLPEGRMAQVAGDLPAPEPADGGVAWIDAIRGEGPASGRFERVAACSEALNLGAVALRAGRRIVWDAEAMSVTNHREANRLLRRDYRSGWEL